MGGVEPRRGRGERKLVTMLFADLSGYTALAESLDPEEVYGFLRPTMAELQSIVESYGGTVPQIQGDGFMAVFGVPVAHEDDPERAVRAALDVRDHVRTLNAGRSGIRLPEVHAGINSGEVMVAPSQEAAGFAVIGDTVNTAARLGDLATAGRVLVDPTTRERTRRAIRYGQRRERAVKNKAEPLVTFEALGVARRSPSLPRGAFVDREDMLALLGRELELVEHEGRSRVLVVTGEPGIGKSRLAQELERSLPHHRLLFGRCAPFGDRRGLSALADAVAAAVGVGAAGVSDAATRQAIDRAARRIARGQHPAALAADLRTLLAVEDDASRTERDAARAARLVLEDVARQGPVAVVLDDLQWADASLVEVLVAAHREPWPKPILLLGLSRERVSRVPTAPLPGLDPGSMRLLAETLLGEDGAGAEEVVGVPIARANGNALFLEEMVGMWLETGSTEVPPTIRLLIAARLDALPHAQKQLLQDASVCGSVTWDALLDAISDMPSTRATLRALVARGLLHRRPRSSIAGVREYEWRHALIRDVAYGALPRTERAERHAEIAAWLRRVSDARAEPLGSIAHHYESAWELSVSKTGPGPDSALVGLAAEYLTRWGEQTFVRQARAAEPIFRRALRITDAAGRGADPRMAARASLGLAEALIEMGSHDEAIDCAERARRLAERAGDAGLTGRALLALGRAESDAGRLRRARRLLEDARVRFESTGDLRGQGWALHRLSETWGWTEFARELDDLRSAYKLFTRARDRFGRAVVAQDLAYILSVEGGAEFRRWYEQARRLVEGDGDLRSRAALLRTWGNFCSSAGRFTEAMEVVARCRPLAAEAGDRYTEADALVLGAIAGANAGDPAAAVALAREAAAIGRELGSVRIPALARLAIARAEVRAGRRGVAARALREARDAIEGRAVRVILGDLEETEAMQALDRGLWDRVGPSAQRLDKVLRAIPMALWSPLPALIEGRALLGAGDAAAALPLLDAAVAAAKSVDAGGTLELAYACRAQAALLAGSSVRTPASVSADPGVAAIVSETAGIAAFLRADHQTAIHSFDAAVDRWEPLGATSWLARALALRAAAFHGAGDRARAAASTDRARDTLDVLGVPARGRASILDPLGGRM